VRADGGAVAMAKGPWPLRSSVEDLFGWRVDQDKRMHLTLEPRWVCPSSQSCPTLPCRRPAERSLFAVLVLLSPSLSESVLPPGRSWEPALLPVSRTQVEVCRGTNMRFDEQKTTGLVVAIFMGPESLSDPVAIEAAATTFTKQSQPVMAHLPTLSTSTPPSTSG
jgi:hypothetical protein